MNGQELLACDDYPVEFIDGVDFLQNGMVVPNKGELLSSCSESLYKFCEENLDFKAFLVDCQRRYLVGDMGEGDAAQIRKKIVKFEEGLQVLGYYETDLLEEGGVLMGFSEELCCEFPENPRQFVALLASEENLISKWYEYHPEA